MNSARFLRKTRAALPVLALVTFWLPVISPLTQPGVMTCSHDGVLHWLRAFQLDELARQGILWPRWAPGLVFGYGYPLFNFYPVLSLYPLLILHRLGLSLLSSWNATLALSMLASGLTMYLWARRVMRERAAFVAAVAYMLAPYQLYDVFWRGTLTESLTLLLLPLGLWAALRTAQTRRWRYALIGALVYAGVLLTHAPASLIFTMVLASYLAMLMLSAKDRGAVALRFAGLVLLGLGLAIFTLAPAFLEKDEVQFSRAITLGEGNFGNNFLAPGEWVGPLTASDPQLINPLPVARSLGWAVSLLAALGALATGLPGSGDTQKHHVVWASLILIVALGMTLDISQWIWSSVPLLPYIQLPWRFLGAGSLLAALLAGAGVEALSRRCSGIWLGVGQGICLLMLATQILPWAYPRLCPMPENPDWAFSVNFEASGFIGTTTLGEYLPVAVRQVPETSPMVTAMRAHQPVLRWDAPEANVVYADDNGLQARLTLESDTATRVTYRAFYFPGWRVRVDGQPADLQVTWPLGLMALTVPAGRHTLTLQFGNTPLRTASEIVSLIVALAVIALWILDVRSTAQPQPVARQLSLSAPAWLALAALGMTLFALKAGWVDRFNTPLRPGRFTDDQIAGAMSRTDIVVGASVRLLGYDLRPRLAASGGVAYVDLYWTLDKPINFLATVRVLDEHGLTWSSETQWDKSTLKGYNAAPASQEWQIGQYALDRHAVRLLPGTPPGQYALVVVPYNPETLEQLPASGGRDAPGSQPGVIIGELEVTAPAQPPEVESLDLPVRVNVPMGKDLALVGYSQDRTQVDSGQAMLLTLGWKATVQPQADYDSRLELIAPDGKVIAQQPFAPGGDHYPTRRWAAGQVIRSQVLAHIPGRAETGQYTWRIMLLDGTGAVVDQATLTSLQINAPQRVFDPPPTPHPLGAWLGDALVLTGFDAPARAAPGQSLPVVLVWQSTLETDRNLKVFVHLVDAQGHLAAQSDAVPANWTRPVSGWQVGEYVTDAHLLGLKPDLAPGEYHLVAGMYDTETGQRLLVASGGDVIELSQVQVVASRP